MKDMIITLFLCASVFTVALFLKTEEKKIEESTEIAEKIDENSPPCVKMFYSIEKYSEKYNVPKDYAYGVAFSETRYQGPFHWKYNHEQVSSAGALGPMQVMYSTAKGLFPERAFTRDELKTDIDFNVECSMKLLHKLYKIHGDWKLVFGAYNTGRPLVNDYALAVYNFKR
jgi:hypothetical protein